MALVILGSDLVSGLNIVIYSNEQKIDDNTSDVRIRTRWVMEHWNEIRTAYQVAKQGTVSGAADVLGVHHATVIRHKIGRAHV